MSKYKPYSLWDRSKLDEALQDQCKYYNLPIEVRIFVVKACYNLAWNPSTDYDGCTGVRDEMHPSLPCFLHDYLWVTGQGGKDADYLFKWLMVRCGQTNWFAFRRYVVVRVAWGMFYKWKHKINNNKFKKDKEFVNLLNKIKGDEI